MVKLIKFTALLLAAVFTAEAQAGFYPQTTVLQSTGANLHVNIDSAPTTAVTQSGTWNLGITSALPTGSNVIGGVTQSGGPWTVSAASLPLPTGASTSANQTTAITSLASIDTKLTSPLSIKPPVNTTGSASQTTVTTTASTLTAPANATGFILQNDSVSGDCVRWRVGATATATAGIILFPTDSSPEVHLGANVSVASCSGTQTINIQWIAQ